MTRLLLAALCLSLLVTIALIVRLCWMPKAANVTTTRITLEQVTELNELVTLKVPVQQLVETHLAGYSGGSRCVILAHGEALVSTDLTAAQLEFDASSRVVHITLPPPRVLSCAIDQQASRPVLVMRSGLWRLVPGEAGEALLTEKAFARAQRHLHDAASQPERITQAKAKTERVLSDWFAQEGWQAQVRWRSEP